MEGSLGNTVKMSVQVKGQPARKYDPPCDAESTLPTFCIEICIGITKQLIPP